MEEEDPKDDTIELDSPEDKRERRERSGSIETTRHVSEVLREELESASLVPLENGGLGRAYKIIQNDREHSDDGSSTHALRRPDSPVESMASLPDDSPSVQV